MKTKYIYDVDHMILHFTGTETQRQHANSNNDSYSYSNARTEHTTSNNNQLAAWSDGDNQQTNTGQAFNSAAAHSNGSSTDQPNLSTSYMFAPMTTSQSTTNIDNHHSSRISTSTTTFTTTNNNNLSNILNDTSENCNIGTATILRTKFKKFKKYFTKN